MVRPYGLKGIKRKREASFLNVENLPEFKDAEEKTDEDCGGKSDDGAQGLLCSHQMDRNVKGGVIFVLEKASLEVAKVGKTYQILNADDHANFLRKHSRDPAECRPDIAHQALLAILDSPLNKAGRVRAVYVKTDKGVLFEVKPYVRLPRTFKRFCGLMLQLLQKLSINATGGKGGKLLRVIKNPVTSYFPLGCHKIGLSFSSTKMVQMKDYVTALKDDMDLVFVVGAMAHGRVDNSYSDDYISISGYPLSAACSISRICNSLEQKWNIL